MKIVEHYSHLNGLEFLLVHKPSLWEEITKVISELDGASCLTKASKEARKKGKILYAPKKMNSNLDKAFAAHGWKSSRTDYWVTSDVKLIRKTMLMPPAEQKAEIENSGLEPFRSHKQTDFVKDRVAVEVQFGKYAFIAYDLFVKHMTFFVGNVIDVGIEILPMRELQQNMSSGVPYYEGALYDLIREGRGVPAVPLILVGVAP